MAENLTIARPYAQAVFELAKEHKSFDKWSLALESLALVVRDAKVSKMLKESRSSETSGALLIELLGELLDDLAQNFVKVIAENDRFEVLPEIHQEFVRLRDDFQKVKAVELISARPLDAKDESALVKKLEKKYQCAISLTKTLDPSILGGVIIKVGDEVIDASVKTSLQNLSSTLK